MFHIKNYKDKKDYLSNDNFALNKKTIIQIKDKKTANTYPCLADVNIKYFHNEMNMPIKLEKIESMSKLNKTNQGFYDSKEQLQGNSLSNFKNPNLNDRNLHTFDSNIKTITNDYERKLHTSHVNRGEEIASIKNIKLKSLKSDIFFQNNQETTKKLNLNAMLKRNSSESNVFFLNNKGMIHDRSSEKYYYYPHQQIYGRTSLSNSKWSPNTNNRTLINFSNVDYSLFNTGIRNLSKTKEEIVKSTKLNPILRQKSISESIDIFGISCFNSNKKYVEIAEKHKNAFNLNSNLCSTFLNLHKNYEGICLKPFVKKII